MTNTIETALKVILDKFSKLEEHVSKNFATISRENEKRASEIRELARQLQQQTITEDETSVISENERRNQTTCHEEGDDEEQESGAVSRHRPRGSPARTVRITSNPRTNNSDPVLQRAKDVVRVIKPLKGRDDMGVEDFIVNVKYARNACADQQMLLKLILAEKIVDQAERSIRFISINTYEELFTALRRNVTTPTTVASCRSRLSSIKQGNVETIQSYNLRFRQQLNELYYAVQNKHNRPTARHIALEEEEDAATRTYVQNLKPDIGRLVIPSHPKTMADAQQMAADMELWLKEASKEGPPRRPMIQPSVTRRQEDKRNPPFQNMPLGSRVNLKCDKCGRIGHTRDKCFAKSQNFQSAQSGKLPPRLNNITTDEESLEDWSEPESITYQDNCNTYADNSEECDEKEGYSSTPEQESI